MVVPSWLPAWFTSLVVSLMNACMCDLGHISVISRLYLGHISVISRLYLGYISAISRLYLNVNLGQISNSSPAGYQPGYQLT